MSKKKCYNYGRLVKGVFVYDFVLLEADDLKGI